MTDLRKFLANMADATLLDWVLVSVLIVGVATLAGFLFVAFCAALVESLIFDAFVAFVVVVALALRSVARRVARSEVAS